MHEEEFIVSSESTFGVTKIEDSYPLSPIQQQMLSNALADPGSGVDIEQLSCELHEALDVAVLQRAWRRVFARHPVLRTNLRWDDPGEPRQEVRAQVELPWEEQDWRGIAGSDRDERIAEFLNADRCRGFDLTRAPLFRLTLCRHGEDRFHLILTTHHAILSGRSVAMIVPEAFEFYDALRQGQEMSPPPPRPYRDHVDWLRQHDFGEDEAFWRQTLKGFTAPTPLVVDHAPHTPKINGPARGSHEILLSVRSTSNLRNLAQENGFTLNTLVQGAWALLLSRYSGEADVVFGAVGSNRRLEIEGGAEMTGVFINTLPLRVRLNPDAALIPWLKELGLLWLAMRTHQHTPLEHIQAWSDLPGDGRLFHSTVMFENYDLDTLLRKRGGAWLNRRFRRIAQSSYLLGLAASDGAELRLRIDYDRGRIDTAAAGRLIGHLRMVLEGMADHPDGRLRDIPLLTEAERHQLVVKWNNSAVAFPGDTLLHELFEEQAERTPDQVAVIFEGQELTYCELEARANQLAHCLQKHGVGPDTLVAICIERSLEMVIGILGILKAGGAYVPLESDLPPERVAYILRETESPVMLTLQRLQSQLPADCAHTICLDTDHAEIISPEPTWRAPNRATASNLAYVIYTSGSTGRPKGVMITHAAICNHMYWMKRSHASSAGDVELQKSPFGFDASVWEFFAPLMTDAILVMARQDAHLDPAKLSELIHSHGVSALQVVPSQLRMLLDEPAFWSFGSTLQRVYCGGEALTKELCDAFVARLPHARLFNMYGPTEGAIDSTYWACPHDHVPAAIPIGKPIDNVRAYIVDAQMQLVPIGVPGELLVGGAGLARGYLNDPELTAERFLPDPFCAERGARVYKTGDRARILPDGNIEFLGRLDHQVKIRGVRVEPGEIESGIAEHSAVRQVVVVAQEFAPEDKRLVAYLVVDNPPAELIDEVYALIEAKVSRNMVPPYIVILDALPLTSAGKVDRRRLPIPHQSSLEQLAFVGPRTPTERALEEIWRDVLQLERIGVQENFFELGGHSVLLVKLLSKVNSAYAVNLGVADFLQNPTVEQVARLIDSRWANSPQLGRVVPLQKGQAELPVYFIYAGPSEFRIAGHMGDSHSVFGIEARWPMPWREALAENRVADFPSMEEMAAPYVAAVRAHAGSRPCVMAGLSYAGLIAFEVAHQLNKLGSKVEFVILIDSQAQPPNPYQLAWQVWRQDWMQSPDSLSVQGGWRALFSRVRGSWDSTSWLLRKVKTRLWSYFKPAPEPDLDVLTGVLDEQGGAMPWGLLDRLYCEIDKNYRLRSLDCRGVLLRTAEIEGKQAIAPNETLGWGNLFGRGLDIIPLAGDHWSIFRQQTPTIARAINLVLKGHLAVPEDKGKNGV